MERELLRGERRENKNKGVEERGKGEWNTPTKPSVCWGPFFFVAQPHVVLWKGDLVRPGFFWRVESRTRLWAK